jgi:hypothetical protein
LSVETGADDSTWTPDFSHAATAQVIVDGMLYVGGCWWTPDGGVAMIRRISIDTGTVDSGWAPIVDDCPTDLAADGAGAIYAAGGFTTVNGQPRAGLARFSATTGALEPWNPAPDGAIHALAVADGAVFIAGDFTHINGIARNGLARLSAASGRVDLNWNPAPQGSVDALLAADGQVWAGGDFNGISGEPRLAFASLHASSAEAATTADIEVSGTVRALVRDHDGNLVVGGRFDRADGAVRDGLVRLDPEGRFDAAWQPDVEGTIGALAVGAAGDLYVGGEFDTAMGARNLVRIPTGSTQPDPTWVPAPDGEVTVLAARNDALYVGGSFESIGGQVTGGLVRFPGAELDLSWRPAPDDAVSALAFLDDGSVVAGGCFRNVGGQPRRGLAALDGIGGSALPNWIADIDDDYWDPCVYALALDGQGGLYVGGAFTTLASEMHHGLGRVHAASGEVQEWDPFGQHWWPVIRALAPARGNVFAGGSTGEGGYLGVLRISTQPGGHVEFPWDPYFNADDVRALLLESSANQPEGALLVGGTFDKLGRPSDEGGVRLRAGLVALSLDRIFKDGFYN